MNSQEYFFLTWFCLLIAFVFYCLYLVKDQVLSILGKQKVMPRFYKKNYSQKELSKRWKTISQELQAHKLDKAVWEEALQKERAQLTIMQNRIKILEIIGKKEEFPLHNIRKRAFASYHLHKFSIDKNSGKEIFFNIDEIANLSAMAGKDIDESSESYLQ